MADWRANRDARSSGLVKIFESGNWPFSMRSLRLAGKWPPQVEDPQDLFWDAIHLLGSQEAVKVHSCVPRRRKVFSSSERQGWGLPESFRLELELFGVQVTLDLVNDELTGSSNRRKRRRHMDRAIPVLYILLEEGTPAMVAKDLMAGVLSFMEPEALQKAFAAAGVVA